jgi:hypothetical protein
MANLGYKHTAEARENMRVAHTGLILKSAEHKRQVLRNACSRHHRKLKEKLCSIYGTKCCNPNCKWQNEDGSFGCADIRILQLDHKQGGGYNSRKGISSTNYYRQAIKNPDTEKYQMLCPNCNWIKRVERKEYFHATSII